MRVRPASCVARVGLARWSLRKPVEEVKEMDREQLMVQLPAVNGWVTSSFSNGGGACVEAVELPSGQVAWRNSNDPGDGVAFARRAAWNAFVIGGSAERMQTV
jgi:Domain of unknown function (DUF397)